jgi:biotin carboxylase
VISVGDRPVELAARVARALGLPGHPPGAAAASTNKLLARAYFEAAGLITPWHTAVGVDAAPRDLASRTSYPAVIKPLGLSGSRGVIRVNSPAEFIAGFERVRQLLARPDVRAMRLRSAGTILVEQFIEGREYAVEGLLTRGSFRVLTIFDKPDPLDGPFFEETIYVTPSALKIGEAHAITTEVERAARGLGLWHGPIHAECRLTPRGVFVLEIAARPIGGLCSRVLRFGPDGRQSFEELLLRHARGERVDQVRRERTAAAVMMVPIPRRGIFKRVEGLDDARAVPYINDLRVTAKIDQLLEPLPEAGSYLGFIFARAPRAPDAEQAVRKAHGLLNVIIDPAIPVVR